MWYPQATAAGLYEQHKLGLCSAQYPADMNLTMSPVIQRENPLRPESGYPQAEGSAGPTSPNGVPPPNGLGGLNPHALYPPSLPQHPPPTTAPQQRTQSTSSSGSGRITPPGNGVPPPPTNNNPIQGTSNAGPGGGDPLSPTESTGGGPISSLNILPSTSNFSGHPLNPNTHPSLLNPYMMRGFAGPGSMNPMGRRYPCKLCNAMFDSKAELQIHTQVHMREAKPYKCTHCVKSFANSSYLSQHMRIHLGIKPFGPCQYCGRKDIESAEEWRRHVQMHEGQGGGGGEGGRPFPCSVCGKSFATGGYLSQHIRIHLGIRPYRCEMCLRRFTQLSHLQQHLRTHTGEKPYKCRYPGCEKAFSQLSNLQSHSRCHQTDKPFKCNSCYKCFSNEQDLLDHIPKHKESKHLKIHICPYCGKSYTQATYLAKHMTKHADRRDRDIRLRDMMREEQMWPGRENHICAVHGIVDSCGENTPTTPLHYSFPTPNMMPSQPCTYTPSGISANMTANMGAGVTDPSAFTRLGLLAGRGLTGAPTARNPYFTYDNFKSTAHSSSLSQAAAGYGGYSQLIRLDEIQRFGNAQAASASAEHFQNILKRDY